MRLMAAIERSWRVLLTAALIQAAAVANAAAQTVVVTQTSAGSNVELDLNGARIGSATADREGIASLDVNLPAHGGRTATDVRIAVEVCTGLIRIQLVEAGLPTPAPSADCTHTDIAGLYVMQRVTTFVVDMSQSTPTAWLTQGPAPKTWLHPEQASGEEREWGPLPKGLFISAGGSLALFGDAVNTWCGDASSCSGRANRPALNAAVSFWFMPNIGIEAAYLKPANVTVAGSGNRSTFNTTLQTNLVAIVGKVGFPAGPVRIYALGGATYHWTNSTTTETMSDFTVTSADGTTTTTVTGGTQSFGITAPAWDWLAGGGLEFWIKGPFALYAEGGYAPIKGANKAGGEPRIDDRIIYGVAGVRLHVFK